MFSVFACFYSGNVLYVVSFCRSFSNGHNRHIPDISSNEEEKTGGRQVISTAPKVIFKLFRISRLFRCLLLLRLRFSKNLLLAFLFVRFPFTLASFSNEIDLPTVRSSVDGLLDLPSIVSDFKSSLHCKVD